MGSASKRVRRVRALVIAGGLALGVALIVGIAGASIPQGGVYTGCYMKSGGTLRVIDASQTCKSSETRITWNERGQQGPQGLQGPPGPALITGYQLVVNDESFPGGVPAREGGVQPLYGGQVQVLCPAGKLALGGGGAGHPDLALYLSKPVVSQPGGQAVGWWIEAYRSQPDGNDFGVWVYAICANVQP